MVDLIFELPADNEKLKNRLFARKKLIDRSLIADISLLFKQVEAWGDNAVLEATKRIDGVEMPSIKVDREYIEQSVSNLSLQLKHAVDTAIANIAEVNQALMPALEWRKQIRPGTIIGEKSTALDSVGLYIPARKGPLISTALMLVTAAKVAGVSHVVVGMPPQQEGRANSSTIAAAKIAGANEFIVGNGVAVIAGMTVGTTSIPEVDGIYGPGPAGIAAAMSIAFSYGKRTVMGIGPTDGAIFADETADGDWIARNLMCEAEHGIDSSVLLVTTSRSLADEVAQLLFDRISSVKHERKQILATVFGEKGMGAIAVVPDIESACQIINAYAPEHLMIACTESAQEEMISGVKNAGEILLGHFTPFSAANYAIGITAVLPTNGFAKAFSGITCKDMLKTSTIGSLSESALKNLNPTIEELGTHEGLPSHVDAARR